MEHQMQQKSGKLFAEHRYFDLDNIHHIKVFIRSDQCFVIDVTASIKKHL